MKITNKEYLVDITLKTLEVQQTKQPSKITCEVHYGDNYLKMILQPPVKNGIADFLQQKIRIPYASDLALVFKMLKNNKKQVFLGHYPLQLQKYLKQRNFQIQVKGQSLEQTESKVYFDCRIIDKAIFNSDSDQIGDDQLATPKRKQTETYYSKRFQRKPQFVKPYSQMDRPPNSFLKNPQDLKIMLNQQFSSSLGNFKQIMSKKQSFVDRHNLLAKYSRDQDGFLRSQKILELQNKLLKLRQQERVGSFLIYSLIAGVAFVTGFITA